jgi:5-methylcytosine-specific restriction enzyme A
MHWVFQYRPDEYDLAESTRETLADWWVMNRGQSHVSVGDRIYFFRSGRFAAVTAVGQITRATYERQTHRGNAAVDIVVQSFVIPEMTRSEISSDPVVSSVYVLSNGMQGTNFPISSVQAQSLDALLATRLHDAVPGGCPATVRVLKRSQTALNGTLEAIKPFQGRVVAVQVQFYRDAGQERAYSDQRLDDGDIMLVGRGKRSQGDQQLSHGNAALEAARKNPVRAPFPVYEKLAPDSYAYLGEYAPIDMTYDELDDAAPGYKVYRFRLTPSVAADVTDVTAVSGQNVRVDFDADAAAEIPPARRQYVQAIIVRNRARVGQVKEEAGYRCQRCSGTTAWRTAQGVPYVEVHHIIALGKDGFDNVKNMIALCSDCHRYLHLGRDNDAAIAALRADRGL